VQGRYICPGPGVELILPHSLSCIWETGWGQSYATGHLLRAVDRSLSVFNGQRNRRSGFDGLGLVLPMVAFSLFNCSGLLLPHSLSGIGEGTGGALNCTSR